MQTALQPRRHPWLDKLIENADKAIDRLLRGRAYLPGLQRASAGEALMVLLGDLADDAPERALVDGALTRWLDTQSRADDDLIQQAGGTDHFIREAAEGLFVLWRLNMPHSQDWFRREFPRLLRWAETFPVHPAFDLGKAVLLAAARTQTDDSWRSLWFEVCEAAAARRLRHRLDIGLLGLARLPGTDGPGPSAAVVAGLARWAAALPATDQAKAELKTEWRALRGAFPRAPTFWRGQWQAIRDNDRYKEHAFTRWLAEIDVDLKVDAKGKPPKRSVELPDDINGTIGQFEGQVKARGLDEGLWRPMQVLVDRLENYADVTGDAYYLSMSCTRIGRAIMGHAPGHALALARRSLRRSPTNGHSWSMRAEALARLGRDDLALNTLWEAGRRCPDQATFASQLAGLLHDDACAELALRRAVHLAPDHPPTRVDLARLLARTDRIDEGIVVLTAAVTRGVQDSFIPYNLASLYLAVGDMAEARRWAGECRRHFPDLPQLAGLESRIALGATGQAEQLRHLREDRRDKVVRTPVAWDRRDPPLAAEMAEEPRLARLAHTAEADLLALADSAPLRQRGLAQLDALLHGAGTDEAYPHLVMALADAEHRLALRGRAGRFANSVPLRLALAEDDQTREALAAEFADKRPLIDLVRFAHGGRDDALLNRLDAWTRAPTRWDGQWEAFLQRHVTAHLDGSGTVPLELLAHDALTQAVDVGWDARPKA
ncbi:MAG: hypothetical protein HQL42_09270 [Alphaproteobacteria bacterium]|nr:hypothetical protein [Alphaproteobacteria bacterium]